MELGGTKQTIGAQLCAWVALLLATMLLTGCGAGPSGGIPADAGGTSTASGPGSDWWPEDGDLVGETVIGEAPFGQCKTVMLTDDTVETIEGEIVSENIAEVYDIGPVAAGDRLVITAEAVHELDPVVAVFDAGGNTIIVNDDRNYYGGDFDSSIDVRSRRDTECCYVGVAASHGSRTSGGYLLRIRRSPGGALPEPNPQLVYLNFDGADAVVIGRREPVVIPVFEGSLIGAEFADETELLIEQTVARVRQDYIGLNVDFLSSREGPKPAGPHTTIHFGAYDPGLLGIADYVDEYNHVVTQKAIIFVDTFQAFLPLNPSIEEMANALANVGSHEIGHLLGLNHTHDRREIMDISANLYQMLASQAFVRSPLHEEIFPVGYQDAGRLLVEAVGGDLALFKTAAAEQLTMRSAWYDEGEPVPARLNQPFSTCFCPTCAKHRHHLKDP